MDPTTAQYSREIYNETNNVSSTLDLKLKLPILPSNPNPNPNPNNNFPPLSDRTCHIVSTPTDGHCCIKNPRGNDVRPVSPLRISDIRGRPQEKPQYPKIMPEFTNEARLVLNREYPTLFPDNPKYDFKNTQHPRNLAEPLLVHTGEKSYYKCPELNCPFTSDYKGAVDAHMLAHTGENSYECPKLNCSFTSDYKEVVNVHIRMHPRAKLKSYTCPDLTCTFASDCKQVVNVHMRRHTGEKPFKCPLCVYKAAVKCNFTRHLRKMHPADSSVNLTNHR